MPKDDDDFEVMQRRLARLGNPYMVLRPDDAAAILIARRRADECVIGSEALQRRRASRERRIGLPCCLIVPDERVAGASGRRR